MSQIKLHKSNKSFAETKKKADELRKKHKENQRKEGSGELRLSTEDEIALDKVWDTVAKQRKNTM